MEVPDYSSRSDLNRCLLALAFAIFAISLIVHIASLFGVILIPNGRLQIWGRWGLLLALGVLLVRHKRAAKSWIPAVPRSWGTAWGIAWANAFIYGTLAPIGGPGGPFPWPGLLPCLHLSALNRGQFNARCDSASYLALGLTLFILLWFEEPTPEEHLIAPHQSELPR